MTPILLWFRRDLRLSDNPALQWALAQGRPILPVYCHSPDEDAPWAPGGASRWWLHHSLSALGAELYRRGATLVYRQGSSVEALLALARETGATTLVWNRLYEPLAQARDNRVQSTLAAAGIETHSFSGHLLFEPAAIATQAGGPYRVFTAYWRQGRSRLAPGAPDPAPPRIPAVTVARSGAVEDLALCDRHPWHHKLAAHWQPGEASALERLEAFLPRLPDYAEGRDRPAQPATSRLSPHLHCGEIAPGRLVAALWPFLDGAAGPAAGASAERFLTELGWREFAHHCLHHFPHTDLQSMDARFDDRFWDGDPAGLHSWQRGETGVALVDAGMRELWETGGMHNRVRMVVGSYLTKNLRLHWREGARWFWDCLVDADLACNTLGWQWVAGCGVDAAPYFRVFNPDTQARRFDPQGEYIGRWLGNRPLRPQPLVDLAESRKQALARHATWMRGR